MKLIPSLHTMTEYSFLESTIKIDSLISFAKENGLKELVITDHNNMFGIAKFIHECKKNDIKPIIGVDLDVDDIRLILLAKNYDGYLHIIDLVSKKNYGKEISIDQIDDKDIFVIDHPEHGFYEKHKREPNLKNYFRNSKNKSDANFVEVSFVRTLHKEDNKALDLVDSLRKSEKVFNSKTFEYKLLVEDKNSGTLQVSDIIKQINVEFPKNVNPIPTFDKTKNSKELFVNTIKSEAKKVLKDNIKKKEYVERIQSEVKIIQKLNFEDYFLIIWDLIKWSKKNKIIIGPGRGSAAGSMISYILNITEVDPLEHDLLFERFLNPERVTMPDIDIDIEDTRREEVLNYLFTKYGKENVALISTFQKLAAKSSLRDVGRLMDIPSGDVLAITKLIPLNTSLKEAYDKSIRFRAAIDKKEKYLEMYEDAKKIEGLPRQIGTHAAGVVISDIPLHKRVPVINSSEGLTQVQYSMEHLEENGLLKIDLLGLRNLTILNDIQKEIFTNHKRNVVLQKIPTNDKKTNELLAKGDTNGIFQLESYGMKKTLTDVGVSSIEDIFAIISLYRPGPMDFIKEYSDVKNGKAKTKPVGPLYDKIVKSTNGIIIYQEQIMQIVQQFAGMSFGRADILRRAIGKKKASLIESLKKEFIKNATDKGHDPEEVKRVYSLIEKFADYGFNKSHAVSYSLLSYRMAYLKAWFPYEFYTSLIKQSAGSPNTLKTYINEAKQKEIKILSPDINISKGAVFNKKPNIVLPLSIIKGLGNIANEKIIDERKKGDFKDFFDFVARMKVNGIGESIITSLIKSNSLRSFGIVSSLLDSLPQALRYAEMIISVKDNKKYLDFSLIAKPKLIESKPNIDNDIKNEFEAFGFNLALFKSTPHELKDKIVGLKEKKPKTCVVVMSRLRRIIDKNGNEMGIATFYDSTSEIDVFIFASIYKYIKNTKKDTVVKVEIEKNNNKYKINSRWEEING